MLEQTNIYVSSDNKHETGIVLFNYLHLPLFLSSLFCCSFARSCAGSLDSLGPADDPLWPSALPDANPLLFTRTWDRH